MSATKFTCPNCGRKSKVKVWPLKCSCAHVYSSPTSEGLALITLPTPQGLRAVDNVLDDGERTKLFDNSDPSLIGNRFAAITSALGFPPCGKCEARKKWLNKAHAWLRGQASN